MSGATILDWLMRGGGAVAILGLLTWVVRSRTQMWQEQGKHVRTATFLNHLLDLVDRVVGEIQQTYVETRKAGGAWGDEERKLAKERAIVRLKSYLGVEGWRMLGWLLSTSDNDTLEDYLSTQVEAAVRSQKMESGTLETLAGATANPSLASPYPAKGVWRSESNGRPAASPTATET